MSTLYNRTKTIQAIVIHHMGDGKQPNIPIAQRWNPYNYEYPEYDFGVEFDGIIRQGRPLTVQGAHCISDKPPYSHKGDQWWNKNSIGIGLAGDFTKYPMPQAQFNGLVKLVKDLMKQYNLTLDNIYPHGQTTYTDCPGCTYSKVPALKGMWNYDDFEKAVNNKLNTTIQSINNNQGDDNVNYAVLGFSLNDLGACMLVSQKYGNCAIYFRNTDKTFNQDCLKANTLFVVGGSTVGHKNEKLLSGKEAKDTLQAVVNIL
ncbi:MAG TPA: hypothetical protein DEG71_06135 [Clostridiales bacterium]|nr:hypothetical protein [Clostridiales bacterium]